MKKSILSLLFLLAASIIITNVVFAGNPVPGISIIVKKDSGGVVYKLQTDKQGKFSTKLKPGKHDLTLSYDEIMKALNVIDTTPPKKGRWEITLTFDSNNLNVTVKNKKATSKLTITKDMGVISFTVPQTDTTISGHLDFAIKDNGVK